MTFIYGLADPRSHIVRYVGKSNRPENRLKGHLKDTSNCHRVHWIQSLAKIGLCPELTILEEVQEIGWQEAERRWIVRLNSQGNNLVNDTTGGDGSDGYRHRPDSKARMKVAARERANSPEGRAALLRASAAAANDPEVRRKNREKSLGKHIPLEVRAKMSAALKGRKKPKGFGNKVAEANRRRWAVPGSRASLGNKIKKLWKTAEYIARVATGITPEGRAKMSEAAKRMQKERFDKYGKHRLK